MCCAFICPCQTPTLRSAHHESAPENGRTRSRPDSHAGTVRYVAQPSRLQVGGASRPPRSGDFETKLRGSVQPRVPLHSEPETLDSHNPRMEEIVPFSKTTAKCCRAAAN